MTDTIPIPRELVERAVSALEDSVDMVRNDYATNWRHGMPTRAAQLESLRRSVEAHESALAALRSALTQQAEGATPPSPSAEPADTHAFKNFHRLLCERFGYTHDDKDWRRDLVSLIEHIAAKVAQPSGEVLTRKPLTAAQMAAGREAIFSTNNPFCPCDSKTFRKVVEWTQRQHGIGESDTLAKIGGKR